MELVRVEGFFPAILSPEEWAALEQRLQIRRGSPRGSTHTSDYLLSGIVRCGHCGGPMVGKKASAHKGRQYRNYYWTTAMTSRARCAYYNGHATAKLEAVQHFGFSVAPEDHEDAVAEAKAFGAEVVDAGRQGREERPYASIKDPDG